MLNGNPPTDFLLVYRDKDDRAKFAKAKKAKAGRRASWAWDTITGRAKSKVGIGFYPTNPDGNSRWGAMDFDAHDGNALRARGLALAAFEILHRQPQLYVVLGTSGSEGWHLFAFTSDFHPVGEWTLLLKKVAAIVGAEVRQGICEVFPNDSKGGALPYGIRVPGTWNAKTDAFGLIAFSSLAPLLAERKREGKEYPFLSHATNSVKSPRLHDSEEFGLYRGAHGEWKEQFAITQPSTRRNQLKALVQHIYHQTGIKVARSNAEAQHREADPMPHATLAEHLKEFDDLWVWTAQRWHAQLSDPERERFDAIPNETDRDTFRIVRSFARKADIDNARDFPLPVEHVAARLGISFQAVCKIRLRFAKMVIIEKTAPHVANVSAARYRWLLGDGEAEQPF